MYFVFQIEFNSNKTYISSLIKAYAKAKEIEIEVLQNSEQIAIIAKKDDRKLEQFLLGLEEILPASIYLGRSRHSFMQKRPTLTTAQSDEIPHNIALCPTCQKEMFDVSSPRYYYPFTSCNHCGGQYPFLNNYPFERKNTTMRFLQPCKSCQSELESNPFRENYPLISCIECGINVKMIDKKSERYANDKGSYKRLFEVSAKAISKRKTVLIKTLNGYRKFYKPTKESQNNILMITSANALNRHLMMVTQEFNSLLSIERPILRVSTKSDELKELFGSSTLVKYPDEGTSILLARELLNLGLEYIVYKECDSQTQADFVVDFDIPISPQKDTKLFINQDTKFFINGERGIFPLSTDRGVIDSSSNNKSVEEWRVSMLSVLAEHNHISRKAIGVHFNESLYFLYYNGKEVINVVPPNPFEADSMFEEIAKLREGSDRLVANYKKHFQKITKRLESCRSGCPQPDNNKDDLFTITAIMLELEDESFEGISAKALEFMGKGGIQIDTHVNNNRFDNYAFLASVMSYKIAGVESSLICYSIFESFGDYISEIANQLMGKTGANSITFSGETFANQALFARVQRHLGMKRLLFPQNLPIGRECGVYGELFIF